MRVAEPDLPGDLRRSQAGGLEPANLLSLRPRCRTLPLYLPSAFALAMPTSMRSLINSRSNCAMAPSMLNMSLPVGRCGIDCLVENLKTHPLSLQPLPDLAEVGNAPREAGRA